MSARSPPATRRHQESFTQTAARLGADANNTNSAIVQALRRGAVQTGQQVVRRNLKIQPTLTIRPGFPVTVIVNRDLVLEPYRG
jgi:type IV secretion system protein VirB10